MAVVYVLNKDGSPLMPTTRCGHIRLLLKSGKARVVDTNPFTVQLLYDSPNVVQSLTVGIDPGRTNIGIAVVTDNGTNVFKGELVTRNKDIPKLMTERKAHRQASRSGERKRRQRRAKKCNTVFPENNVRQRLLPGYNKPIEVHYITNTEARFLNRRRPDGWLTPTANNCVQTHLNLLKIIMKILPIKTVVVEVNSFDTQKFKNPTIKPWEYQQGDLFGFDCTKELVSHQQGGVCLLCRNAVIEHFHHIIPKYKNGSNNHANIVGLCQVCHNKVHTDNKAKTNLKALKQGINKQYNAVSIINIAIPYIINGITDLGLTVSFTDGKTTKETRRIYSITKTHANDAYCIALSLIKIKPITKPMDKSFCLKQYRRHDRQVVHKAMWDRKYYLNGELVATNRNKAFEQKINSLIEYKEKLSKTIGLDQVEKIISKLQVKPHKPIYKRLDRILPGAMFSTPSGVRVLNGTNGFHNGRVDYYVFENNIKYSPNRCKVIKHNKGILFLNC